MDKCDCKDIKSCEYIKKLEDMLLQRDRKIESLEGENDILKNEVKNLRGKLYGRKSKKDKQKKQEKTKKKRGSPVGHPGWSRKVPDKVDEIVDVYPDKCPHCGNKDLNDLEKVEEHIQEDIIFPKIKVTKYTHHFKYCSNCKKVIGSGPGKDELLNSYIGPSAKALSVFFKYHIKMSDRDLQKTLKLFGLSIVPSSIPGFRNQLRKRSIKVYEYLLEQIKKSDYVNADETGWKLDGDNHWLWNFSNNKISVNHIDKSRGRKVAQDILGEHYKGVVVSDFLSVYDKFKNSQRCRTHLMRDVDGISELYQDNETVQVWCKRLKDILYSAKELKEEHYEQRKYTNEEYLEKCKEVEDLLDDLQFVDPQKGKLLTLTKRLAKYKKQLFTFLYHKNVPDHNNHAEQQIRPNVLMRKVTFGNRSQLGVLNHNVLMSIIQTGKLNNHKIYDLLKYAFVANNADEVIQHILPP